MNCLPLPLEALSPPQWMLSASNNRLETGTPVYVTAGELPVSLTYWLNNKSTALFCVSSKTRNVWINLEHVLCPYTYKYKRAGHAVVMRYSDVIMSAMVSQIISVLIVCSTSQKASNAEIFPFDYVIMWIIWYTELSYGTWFPTERSPRRPYLWRSEKLL